MASRGAYAVPCSRVNPGYAVSDLVLVLACAFIAARTAKARPGVALACATIGIAAVFGVVRFSGVADVSGAHRFLSLIGGTAALPLLAASMAWPHSKAATTPRGAALMLLVASALGVAIVVGAGFALWGQAVPAASAIAMLVCLIRKRDPRKIGGATLLVVTFGLVAGNVLIGPLEPLEILHYGMTVALLLLCL